MGLFSIRKTNTVFYNSGEIEIVYQTLNNQLDGWHKIYHKNGQLKTIVNCYKFCKCLIQACKVSNLYVKE